MIAVKDAVMCLLAIGLVLTGSLLWSAQSQVALLQNEARTASANWAACQQEVAPRLSALWASYSLAVGRAQHSPEPTETQEDLTTPD